MKNGMLNGKLKDCLEYSRTIYCTAQDFCAGDQRDSEDQRDSDLDTDASRSGI